MGKFPPFTRPSGGRAAHSPLFILLILIIFISLLVPFGNLPVAAQGSDIDFDFSSGQHGTTTFTVNDFYDFTATFSGTAWVMDTTGRPEHDEAYGVVHVPL